LSGIRDSNP